MLLCQLAFGLRRAFDNICLEFVSTFPAKARWWNCIGRMYGKIAFPTGCTSLYDITCTSFIHACMRAEQTRRQGPFLSSSFLPVLCWRRARWRRDSRHGGGRAVKGSKKLSSFFVDDPLALFSEYSPAILVPIPLPGSTSNKHSNGSGINTCNWFGDVGSCPRNHVQVRN